MRTAALYIAAGDLDGYHRLCAEMLERFQAPGAQEIAERVAKACLFVPPADANLPAAVELARKSVADPTYWVVPYALSTRGLADYREGNFPGAKGWLQQALRQPPMWFVKVQAYLLLAMSEYQLKDTEAARSSLQEAKNVMDSQAPNYRAGTLGNNWHDWLYSQALLREAEALLRGQ